MMELVEGAIPVIQHASITAQLSRSLLSPAVSESHARASSAESPPVEERQEDDDRSIAEFNADLAKLEQVLSRLRSNHAQFVAGTLLQQYQRQSVSSASETKQPLKVLSIQG